jgi:hypothetical protein
LWRRPRPKLGCGSKDRKKRRTGYISGIVSRFLLSFGYNSSGPGDYWYDE